MDSKELLQLAEQTLEEMKAQDIRTIDVTKMTSITDYLVVASGTSNRHVRSIADNVAEKAKEAGVRPLGVEGSEGGEWVLVDLDEVIVHVMQPRIREFYKLEDLWSVSGPVEDESAEKSIV
jgi:ribosome-associated protein